MFETCANSANVTHLYEFRNVLLIFANSQIQEIIQIVASIINFSNFCKFRIFVWIPQIPTHFCNYYLLPTVLMFLSQRVALSCWRLGGTITCYKKIAPLVFILPAAVAQQIEKRAECGASTLSRADDHGLSERSKHFSVFGTGDGCMWMFLPQPLVYNKCALRDHAARQKCEFVCLSILWYLWKA